MHSRHNSTLRLVVCEESKVRTVHRGWKWRV